MLPLNSTGNSTIGNPMVYTLSQAAKATGKDKSTISKAIKKGKISAARNEDGSYKIDPVELHRWYPPVNQDQDVQPVADSTPVNAEFLVRIKELEVKLEGSDQEKKLLRQQIDLLETDKDFLQQQLTRTTALLTDQREKDEEKAPTFNSAKIWAGLFIVVVIGLIVLAASFWPVLQNLVTG